MNMTFKVEIERQKIEAIRCYLPEGESIEDKLNEEVVKAAKAAVDRFYVRNVPKKVQDFLKKTSEMKESGNKKAVENINERH